MSVAGRILAIVALLVAAAPRVEAQDRPSPRARAEADRNGWLGLMLSPGAGGSVVVTDVFPGSPAAGAGLRTGDTVVAWNGARDVAKAMKAPPLRPGDAVKLRVRRAGARDREVTVTARARPDRDRLVRRIVGDSGRTIVIQIPDGREFRILGDSLAIRIDSLQQQLRIVLRDSLAPHLRVLTDVQIPEIQLRARELAREMGPTGFVFGFSRAVAGAEFADLNPDLASYFGTERGVLVVRVGPDTPAAKSGLQAGDVITGVGGRRIAGVQELRREVVRAQEQDRHSIPVELVRKGQRRSLELRW